MSTPGRGTRGGTNRGGLTEVPTTLRNLVGPARISAPRKAVEVGGVQRHRRRRCRDLRREESPMDESTRTHPGVDREVARITELMREARARTLRLIEPLSDEELRTQHDPLMSPIVWDLGHIAHFEELWLTRNVHGTVEFGEMPGIYNPFEHPRRVRGALDLPGRDEVVQILNEVRERVLKKLESLDLEAGDPLLRDGYVYAMVAQHEYQHNETILQTLQLKRGAPYRAPRGVAFPETALTFEPGAMVRCPGGNVPVGTCSR